MGSRAPVLYHEAQSLGRWHGKLVLAMPPAGILFITYRQLVWHHPWGNPPVSDGGLVFLAILALLVYMRLVTVKLVTDLLPKEVVVGLKGVWRLRRIPWIRSAPSKPSSTTRFRTSGRIAAHRLGPS